MPRPKALSGPEAAKRTLVSRLTRPADRLRQFYTRFGLRRRRVFLVWTRWTGEERGEGSEKVLERVELLPTPRVSDATTVVRRPWSAGTLPEGSLRIDQISCGAYTADNLKGLLIPDPSTLAPRPTMGGGTAVLRKGLERGDDPRTDFFWELVEDGRGDAVAARERYRLLGEPWSKEDSLYWSVVVERASEDMSREGTSQVGPDAFDK